MRTTTKEIDPEDYILSVLSPEQRLDSAFKIVRQAFKNIKEGEMIKDSLESNFLYRL